MLVVKNDEENLFSFFAHFGIFVLIASQSLNGSLYLSLCAYHDKKVVNLEEDDALRLIHNENERTLCKVELCNILVSLYVSPSRAFLRRRQKSSGWKKCSANYNNGRQRT